MSLESMISDNAVAAIGLIGVASVGMFRVRASEKAIAALEASTGRHAAKLALHDTNIAVLTTSATSTHDMLKSLSDDVHDMRKMLARLAANLDKE